MSDRLAADDQPAPVLPTPPQPHTAGTETAVAHLYRGELGRMTAYRRRLDTTTNWAISFVGAMASLSLGSDSVPHTVLIVAMLLSLFFLFVEARRFRHYEISRVRVRMLEAGYFPDMLTGSDAWPWVTPLLDHLRRPKAPLDMWAAVGWRLRRNYFWIYAVLLLTWLLKLTMSAPGADSVGSVLAGAAIGGLPGPAVVIGVMLLYAGEIALIVMAPRRYPDGEDW